MDSVMILSVVLGALLSVVFGLSLGFLLSRIMTRKSYQAAKEASEQHIRRSEARSKEILVEAKEQALQTRSQSDRQINKQRVEVQRMESRLEARQESFEVRSLDLNENQKQLEERLMELQDEQSRVKLIKTKAAQQLESLSGLTSNEAKELLLEEAKSDIAFEVSRRYRDAELAAQNEVDEKARIVLAESLQRYASEVVQETTISSVSIPNDDMKGRLIGREGRNIRAIESSTGADLIIDDVPETVSISCFDPIRREVAKLTLERLIKDGRIHPAKIEETVERARDDIEDMVKKSGQKAMFEVNVKGLHPELVKLMGRLKFRFSYGENVLQHSVEVGSIAAMLASQIGANTQTARTAGFLHDIGKALTHEVEGSHAVIGADIAKRYGMKEPVVTSIKEHHDTQMTTPEAFIVAAADAISAARPGARHDTLEAYMQRLEDLENVAKEFEGIEKVFAIQAGREVRILVNPQTINDVEAANLARDIVTRIEEKLAYPGQIKVVVIRESRVEQIAS